MQYGSCLTFVMSLWMRISRYDFIHWAGGQDIVDFNDKISSIEIFNSLCISSNVLLGRQ